MKAKNRIYVHYGANEFDATKVYNPYWNDTKPYGLWASQTTANYPWKEWVEDNDFHVAHLSKHFNFKLTPDSKILVIRKEKDILPYIKPWEETLYYKEYGIDRRIMAGCYTSMNDELDLHTIMKKFDGMELLLSNNYNMRWGIFHLWDCDSICVWNLNKVIPL